MQMETRSKLLGSFLLFTKTFYKLRTGREFKISCPNGRESHHISISRELTKLFRWKPENKNLIINVPPRYGKTELLIHFIAWTMAKYPDSNFIYVSYSHTLAKKQTQTIREIMQMPAYRKIFGVDLKEDVSAKDNFETTAGGTVYAAGAGGTITGRGAGIQNVERFGGCIVIDDIHKPSEVTSDTMRQTVINWYYNTLQSRLNSSKTPIIFIGQRLHEDDLAAKLTENKDYGKIILPSLDVHLNALNPDLHTSSDLQKMQELSPYEFAAQYQQDPQPAGGGLFRPNNFLQLEQEPKILLTFITADTAETEKTWNDKTVFSFWGLYKVESFGEELDVFALHWLDCVQLQVEPKDLENEFMQFMGDCMHYKIKPTMAAIEKKSTGVTLLSNLQNLQGIRVIDIQRTKESGSKTDRFIQIQPFINQKLITLPAAGKHTAMCIEHMRKITANNSHRFDDIADTCYDAIKLALIDKVATLAISSKNRTNEITDNLIRQSQRLSALRKRAYHGGRK